MGLMPNAIELSGELIKQVSPLLALLKNRLILSLWVLY
jgi:hypothetical protein